MRHERRTFLRTVGVGCAGVITAGCSSSSDDGRESTDPDDDTEDASNETDGTGGDSDQIDVEVSANTVITVEAGGADIWNQVDKGHFYYEEVSGDFDVRVEVTSLENTNPHAKAGIMARDSLEGDSANVMIRKRPAYGTSPQWRPRDGAETTSTTSEDGAPLSRIDGGDLEDAPWQRLERSGGTIRAYGSSDGEDWTLIAEIPPNVMELDDEVYLGLAATSHERAQVTTAKFRNLEGVSPDENQDIGNPIMEGSVSVSESAVISTLEPDSVSDSAATLRAEVESLGAADSVDVRFAYREVTEDEWTETEAETVSEAGDVAVDVSGLTGRRYYEFRAIGDDGDEEVTTIAERFATPSASSGSDDDGPRSASQFDPGDGFAEVAPWLDDDTPLVVVREPTREALSTAIGIDGPRVVVFETSGTIDLGAENLNVRNDECWIAGQTAPSPGITLIRGGLWLYGDDCVVQHVRVRPGDAGQDTGWEPDAINTADGSKNNVIDHCTGTWSVDENINTGYDTENTTISNCLAAEPLNDATHSKGEHGYNTIVGDNSKDVALAGNVWALGTDRNPRLKQGTETVVVNNLIHHYHDGMWADPDTAHSIVGNVFERPQTDQANVFGEGRVYAEDNRIEGANQMIGDDITELSSRPLWPDGLEAIPSSEVKAHNLANAGARPADRTEHDERIVEHVRNGTGGVIDSQEEVGGYPELAENTRPIDEPDSGLRAWLREQALAVETTE